MNSLGVICEIVNDDDTMARLPDLTRFCMKHDFKLVSVADLAQYRSDLAPDDLWAELEKVL
jgi:3,4-dihydroxy 2-butanone 4-phosphate synthase/GTP cyclohydrolase II